MPRLTRKPPILRHLPLARRLPARNAGICRPRPHHPGATAFGTSINSMASGIRDIHCRCNSVQFGTSTNSMISEGALQAAIPAIHQFDDFEDQPLFIAELGAPRALDPRERPTEASKRPLLFTEPSLMGVPNFPPKFSPKVSLEFHGCPENYPKSPENSARDFSLTNPKQPTSQANVVPKFAEIPARTAASV